jgi:Asp-tRNA(Asn)/Glu-tRNA(Gln) amidotransferase A subunit family amidase
VAGSDLPPAAELLLQLRSGQRSAVEVATDVLERIAAREDDLHAWAHLDPERALARARELDALPAADRGPLHGLPVGVKDIIDTADLPTEHGSPIYAGHRPARDAPAVARLRSAGAVVVGKTVTTEFALFHPGPTVNPHDPTRTPGGSSSGSAAAVGAGTLPLAVGTQTAGSVVRPASFCGVVGAKPTLGAVPTAGVKPCSETLDTVGVFAADVEGAAMALGVLADDPPAFRPADLGDRPRIGFCRTPWWSELEPDAARTIEAAAEGLARELDLVEVALPAGFDGLVAAQQAVMGAEVLRALAHERTTAADQLSDRIRAYLADAETLAAGYDDGLALATRCREALPDVFASVDVLLAPSVLGEAPPLETTGDPLLCRAWTLLGTPTVAVPGLTGPAGLPLGVQVIAPVGRDDLALGGAARLAPLLGA